jgi:16S rRNA (cytidine1402-2'-O)-methyltransferase
MTSRLYVVATPIGHLDDLGPRAARTLREVDVVAAEDTRVTRVLLQHAGSTARLISARAHNEAQAAAQVVELLAQGRSVALVSDAGTPAISDPGARVVAAVRAAGYPVVPIPGPSALTTLLSAAGLDEGPVLFEGFLPARPRARRERLDALAQAAVTAGAALVFYEAPHRIDALLADLLAAFGPERRLVIGRELTKLFEEIAVLPLADAAGWLDAQPQRRRGEFVLALARPADASGRTAAGADEARGTAGAQDNAAPAMPAVDPATRRLLDLLLAELPPARAARLAHAISGVPRETLYALALTAGGR